MRAGALLVLVLVPALARAQPTPAPEPAKPDDPKPAASEPMEVQPPPPDPVPVPPQKPVTDPPGDIYEFDIPPPPEPFPDHSGGHRFDVELELFTSGNWTFRDSDDLAQFRLDRGELGATLNHGGRFGAELRLETVRSGAEGGALGIAGDSLVIRPKRAQLFLDFHPSKVAVRVALGVTPDPWLSALDEDYPLRPMSATASERLLGWPPSDLAALVRVTSGPVRLSVSVGNGEGLAYPERNNGKTTTAVAEIVPFHAVLQRLRFMIMGKNGSVGPGLVRDHRVGGGVTFYNDILSAGGELVRAWGVGDRGDIAGWLAESWVDFHTGGPFRFALRGATMGYDAGGRHSSFGFAFAVTPFDDDDRDRRPFDNAKSLLRIWLAVDRTTASGNAAPLPGADPGNATTVMVIGSTTLGYGAAR